MFLEGEGRGPREGKGKPLYDDYNEDNDIL